MDSFASLDVILRFTNKKYRKRTVESEESEEYVVTDSQRLSIDYEKNGMEER